jgi:dienelactone hydrolase
MIPLLLSLLPGGSLAESLEKLAPTLARPGSLKAEASRVREGLKAANAESSRFWARLKASEDRERLLRPILQALDRSLSTASLTGKPEDLQLSVRRTIEGDGYRLALITFRSRTGMTVTAHLYSPLKPGKSAPGLVLVHSHHNPKHEGELQDMGQMWARAGCHVLSLDLLGHGERRQHPFASVESYPSAFRVSRQDYFFRHHVGLQLQTAGESLMGWMAADISAAVSVLLAQPGADPEKVAVLGSVAGGGDPAAVAAALDQRIKAAVVFNFGGPQPETRYPLPDDAEESFHYAGGGSWETTRNLAFSARDGFLPWVIVASIAPRKLVYAHEFSWDEKRDPVWARLREVWKSTPGSLRSARGFGTLTGKGDLAGSHCNNIGAAHRKEVHAAFRDWWGVKAEEPAKRSRRPAAELACLKAGDVLLPARAEARQLAQKSALPADRDQLRERWAALLGGAEVKAPEVRWVTQERDGYSQHTGEPREGAWRVTLLTARAGKLPVAVICVQGGAAEYLAKRPEEAAAALGRGEALALVDLGGTADLPPGGRGRGSEATAIAASALMLGKPLLGERVRAFRAALAALRSRADIDATRAQLVGGCTSKANAPGAGLIRPLEHAQPAHAEPVGAHVVLLAALFEDGIADVSACGGLASWLSLLDEPVAHFPYDNVVPGSALADWPGVCQAARASIRLEGPRDGLNRAVGAAAASKLYQKAENVTLEE